MAEYRGNKEFRKKIRQDILKQRRVIPVEDSFQAGLNIVKVLRGHEFFSSKKIVASYISTGGEISTAPLNDYLLDAHDLILPYININVKGSMDFYSFKKGDPLIENRFHILEPENKQENLIRPDLIDAIVVPLVAFDKRGNRMGMGGGFYDRMLKKVSAECLLIGVAYDFQLIENVPTESWDMPLDEVITPTTHFIFNKKWP
ncbi:5-formyltetrahydrofolate cyclo-ligase [uncultured Succinivibrio sp.]|uniref:5-formyltetrahydrofolate cyclo-ligase n=1 Tax=uncultured Succinivibrio sp. TaxID=540749 RepID=UPI0025E21FAB|nr:5-formyltetrahydrofolate cyclo-ligase [uncultured Succinivibrio sp.]